MRSEYWLPSCLFRFNIDNKYGRVALEATFKAIMGYEQPIVKPPSEYRGDFFKGKPQLESVDCPAKSVDNFPIQVGQLVH